MNTKLNDTLEALKTNLQGKVLTNQELQKEIFRQAEILGLDVSIHRIEYLPDGRQEVTMIVKFKKTPDNMWEDKRLIHSGRKKYI